MKILNKTFYQVQIITSLFFGRFARIFQFMHLLGDDTMSIWRKSFNVGQLNSFSEYSIEKHLGITVVECGNDFLKATMPVDKRTRQPFGLLHGGASVVLAETLGSIASYLVLPGENQIGVGIEINANHIQSVREGTVTGIVKPIRIGNRIHVWEIKIFNDTEDLVCISRLTVAVVAKIKK
jgi:1,4-dihydroxy-2-naphthoyl-CoA hydrolase